MDPILEVTRRRGLFVIEDAAQAHGAKYKGRSIGSVAFLSDQESRQYCVCDLWLGTKTLASFLCHKFRTGFRFGDPTLL